MEDTANYSFKVVMVGPYGTGKTSLLARFTGQGFDDYVSPTVCAGFTFMECNYLYDTGKDDTAIPIKFTEFFWDTAGQERYTTTLLPNYMRDADVLVLVFNAAEFDETLFMAWLHKIADIPMGRPPAVFVALNKSDLLDEASLSKWKSWVRHLNSTANNDAKFDTVRIWSMMYANLTSAKLRDGVNQLHEAMQGAQALMVLDKARKSNGRVILPPKSEQPCRKQDNCC